MKLTLAGLALVAGASALSYVNTSVVYTTTTICPVTYTSGNKLYTSLTTSTIVVTSCPHGCPTPATFVPFTPSSPPLSTAPPKPYTTPVPVNVTQILITNKPKTSYRTQNTTVITTYCPTTNTTISVGTGKKTIPLTLSATTLTSTYATLTTVPVVTSNVVVTPPVVPITSTIQTSPTPVVTTILSTPPAVTCPITQIGDGQPQIPLSCSSIISSVPAIETPAEAAPPPAEETPAVAAPPPAEVTPAEVTPAEATPAGVTPAESASVAGATAATFTGAAVRQSVAGLAGGVVALAALVLA